MAEQIISPGVFTRENDLSFLPQGIGAIGAAIIGPTDKGPAFVPTVITSFSDFQDRFGNLSSTTYVPQTVQEYLRNAGSVTVCRVLAGGGYTFSLNSVEPVGVIAGTGGATAGTFATGKIVFQHVPSGSVAAGGSDEISIGGVDFTFVSESAGLTNTATQIFVEFPGTTTTNATNLTNAINNNSTLHGLGITAVADTNDVQLSGSAVGLLSITVTTGSGGDTTATTPNFAVPTSITGGTGATLNGGLLLGLIYPSKVAGATNPSLETSVMAPTSGHVISSSFAFHVKGTGASSQTVGQFSASLNPANQDYLFNQLGYNSNNSKTGVNTFAGMPGYTYLNFKKLQEPILGTGNLTGYGTGIGSGSVVSLARMSSTDCEFKGLDSPKTEGYGYATTPFIQSQLFNGVGKDLFRFHTINHGRHLCHEYKISITGLQEPADIDGVEQYSRFNVLLRRTSDRDSSVSLIESFNNVNLNPASPDFISRRIGDRYPEYNENLDKVELLGNYPNVSPHIRVEVAESVTEGSYSPKLSPKGFKALRNTFNTQSLSVNCTFPSSSFEGVQTISSDGTYDGKGYLGFKFIDKAPDNENFLQPVPTNVTELNIAGAFNVENFSGHPSSSLWSGSLSASLTATGEGGPTANQLKFSVPFQGGDDGLPPWRVQNIGGQIANNMDLI